MIGPDRPEPGAAPADSGGTGAPPAPTGSNRAPDLTREYRGAGISVQWYAGRCVHAAACIRALPTVFDPQRRPWIDLDAADASADRVADAVLRCPTGALHFVRHDGGPPEAAEPTVRATPLRDGPLLVRGDVEVAGPDGVILRRDTRLAFCRCGRSGHMPFCDNSHRATGWREPAPPPPGAGAG